MLQRRQILLDDKVTLELMEIARDEGRSFSDLARDILSEKVKQRKMNKKIQRKNAAEVILESIKKLDELALIGEIDSSTNDNYIYR